MIDEGHLFRYGGSYVIRSAELFAAGWPHAHPNHCFHLTLKQPVLLWVPIFAAKLNVHREADTDRDPEAGPFWTS